MTEGLTKSTTVAPRGVRQILQTYTPADGFDPIIALEKSHGSWIVDARDGREYLDLFTMFASMPVGYNHPRLLEATDRLATAAVNKPTNSDIYCTQLAEFVETFFEVAIRGFFKYGFFIEGGALGVENALKSAFDWKVKKNLAKDGKAADIGSKVIHFEECFHGRTGYTLSLTNTADPRKTAYFPKFDWPRIVNPKITFPLNEENSERVRLLEERALDQIKSVIHEHGEDIASMIIEPIQAEGGDNHFRGEFLDSLRTICDENDIMLVFDEVQTGMGITGKMWAWEHFEVVPDLMCFGKKSQVCGFVSTARIDDIGDNVFKESSRINSTWGGNLTDMVRSTLYLEIMRDEDLLDAASTRGEYLLAELRSLQADFPESVSNVRGRGLMCAFDLPRGTARDRALQLILEDGAFILGSGKKSIRFRPPLNISRNEIDLGMEIIRKTVDLIQN
ncbi:MAG: L-lysine 6-transaminase [Candidatus Neomarinimicrobiota bacterium]